MYSEATKRYEKVDSFLKRFLSPGRYKGVRLTEPCVVVSSEYNKLFKFVVLADDWLYITENPPKVAKDIQGITKVVNITSVELLNDVPEFLGGDLKYRAHHIWVTYKKVSDVALTSQNPSQVPETSVHNAKETKSNHVPDQNSNYTLPLRSAKPEKTHENYSTNSTKSKSSTINKPDAGETNGLDQDGQILGNESLKKSGHRRLPQLPNYNSFESESGESDTKQVLLHHSCSSLDQFKSKTKADNARPMRLTASANAADLRAAKGTIRNGERLSTSGSEPNLISSQKERGLLSSFNGLQRRFKERRSSKTSSGAEKKSVSGNESKEFEDEDKSEEIHLYMLLDDTIMLAYLRSTWDNCLLNAALRQNKKGGLPKSSVKNEADSPFTPLLFDQLKMEIINSKEIESTFVLVNELLTACQKNASVKKLFWQSPELFVFMVQQLKCYNEQTPCNHGRKRNRADELEFIILILDCLTQMFRETELLAMRLTVLKTKKCRVLRDLLEMTIFSFETQTSKLIEPPEISEAAEVLLTGRPRKKKEPKKISPQDIELESLSNELTKCQVVLLHELFIIAYQAVWFPSDDNKFNIFWMVNILESSKTVYRFIQHFVRQVMSLIEMAETCFLLSSDDATMLYRLFSVLKIMLQQSTRLCQHIQEYYTEEFRYYVKLHTLSKCLSKHCLLTSSTLKLVEDVTHLITVNSIISRGVKR